MTRYITYIVFVGILILTYKSGIISFPIQEVSIITSDKKYNANKPNTPVSPKILKIDESTAEPKNPGPWPKKKTLKSIDFKIIKYV